MARKPKAKPPFPDDAPREELPADVQRAMQRVTAAWDRLYAAQARCERVLARHYEDGSWSRNLMGDLGA